MSNLSEAVDLKDLKAVKALLAGGADPNEGAVLCAAMELRSKSIVKALLAAGADPNVKDQWDANALHHLAMGMRDAKIGALLVSAGVDLNALCGDIHDQLAALHAAVAVKKLDFANFLIESGADIEVKCGDWQDTPLLRLLRSTSGEMSALERQNALWLLEHGANPNATNDAGLNALHLAARSSDVAFVDQLIERGAALALDPFGASPLRYTMRRRGRDKAMWARLLELGADINEIANGESVLMFAQLHGNVQAIRWLLERGADVSCTDKDGKTVRERAVELDQPKVLAALP